MEWSLWQHLDNNTVCAGVPVCPGVYQTRPAGGCEVAYIGSAGGREGLRQGLSRRVYSPERYLSPHEKDLVHLARRLVSVPEPLRDLVYSGYRFGAKAPSNLVHLAKRVVLERQWKPGTTLNEYEQDLRDAIRHKDARIVVYRSRDITHLAVLSPNTVPRERLGVAPDGRVWVVYDVDHDTIVTGYQVPGLEAVRLPKDARWLK